MEKWLNDMLPILEVEQDSIVSKQGDVTIGFKVSLPEVFTSSADDFETIHQAFIKAIKLLPKETVFHKQDWFTRDQYQPLPGNGKGFLEGRADRHFAGRRYLRHQCYLFLTRRSTSRKKATSLFSNLIRPNLFADQVLNVAAIREFEEIGGQFQRVLADCGIDMVRLRQSDLLSTGKRAGLLEQYLFLAEQPEQTLVKDIQFRDELRVGSKFCQLYSLGSSDDLPHVCGPRITYEPFSTDRTKFSIGFATPLGLLLDCNHIYNQYIFVGDAQSTVKKMESKRLRHQSLSQYSRENAISKEATDDFLNEAITHQRLPVNAHFNILTWSEDRNSLQEARNSITGALAQLDATAKLETIGAPQIFWAGIPGNAADFPSNDTFITFAEQACCFLHLEGNYRSDPEGGIRFCDRLTNRPVFIDLFDRPRKMGVSSNMGMLICGTSGGGKSMTANHILHSLYNQGAHCVVCDIGGSYRALCELVGGYYFEYKEDTPIQFNPFYLPPGQRLDTEKKESLKSLLVALWKQEHEQFQRSEYVALSNALQGYYRKLEQDSTVAASFNTFYDYLQNEYAAEIEQYNVKDRDFDLANFLYVLRPYYADGEYGYLLNSDGKQDLLNQPFVVIEMDNLKDHPILFGVCTLLVMEMVISKMRQLKGKRKCFLIDEAWKAIANAGMAQFVKYAYKTMRKFDGIPAVVTQELDDLISSPVIKDAIIANCDIKILMDMRKFQNKFDQLQSVLGMSEKGKEILLSVNRDDREIYIEIGGKIMKVFRNELAREEYFAFTTEGKERVMVMEYARRYGSMEKGISALVEEHAA
ncbi:TraG family conjugative transposon ATPase [Paraflavitalea pollutisoli]|uniref:TraG family conjugative transposon ATPase n=1 Tax=Paraflavitalea pollutisoli TaxID=3034143 RepID=UPI0023EDB123|nr:TraG family conjugative transposon ATPase [Paraflavitalea sp. H1-2-19X]